MSEMVERVARAMARRAGEIGIGNRAGEWSQESRNKWFGFATAAIEAMREPTEAMAEGGWRAFEDPAYAPMGEEAKRRYVAFWHDAIDFALSWRPNAKLTSDTLPFAPMDKIGKVES